MVAVFQEKESRRTQGFLKHWLKTGTPSLLSYAIGKGKAKSSQKQSGRETTKLETKERAYKKIINHNPQYK